MIELTIIIIEIIGDFMNPAASVNSSASTGGVDTWQYNFHPVKDIRELDRKIQSFVRSIFNHIKYLVRLIYNKITFKSSYDCHHNPKPHPVEGSTDKFSYDLSQMSWKTRASEGKAPSEGLYLFIHGLKGHPTVWKDYTKRLTKEKPQCDVIAPYVHLRGNCPLENAAEPVLQIVREYIKDNPGKPLYITGTSNGGRIAAYIETHLDPEQMNGCSLHFVSVAGVHAGTKRVEILPRNNRVVNKVIDPELVEEFRYNGSFAQGLHQKLQQKQKQWKNYGITVTHRYYASKEDTEVTPTHSALPKLDDGNTSYQILEGESHGSIVKKVCNDVIKHFEHPIYA